MSNSELEGIVEDIKQIMPKMPGIAFELLLDLLASLKHFLNDSLRKAFAVLGPGSIRFLAAL